MECCWGSWAEWAGTCTSDGPTAMRSAQGGAAGCGWKRCNVSLILILNSIQCSCIDCCLGIPLCRRYFWI